MVRTWFVISLSAATLLAQAPTGTVSGSVTDSSGGTVANARAAAINQQTGVRREATSEADGFFRFPDMPPGSYDLTIAAPGFRLHSQKSIEVAVNRNVTVNVTLQVGSVTERVDVTSAPPQVDFVKGGLSSLVGAREAQEFPLNGRGVLQLIALNPGINNASTSRGDTGTPTYAVNGARGNKINFFLDGATQNDDSANQASYFPNPDALQEFSLMTNSFSAEYGEAAGGVVNAVSRSGTNSFHGSVFEFVRNERLNATNYFSRQKDRLKRNQYGGTLGGPAWIPGIYKGRDKTFFFYSFQQTPNRFAPTNLTAQVPTAAERAGDFSQTALPRPIDPATGQRYNTGGRADVIPPALLDRGMLSMLNALVPLPNAGGNLLRFTRQLKEDTWEHLAKVDHNINVKNTVSGRFFIYDFTRPVVLPGPGDNGGLNIFVANSGNENRDTSFALTDTHLFSPTRMNVLTISYHRLMTHTVAPFPDRNPCDFGRRMYCYPGALRFNTPQFGFPGETNTVAPRNSYRLADNVNWNHGIHTLKIGLDFRYVLYDSNTDSGANGFPSVSGQVTGNAFADTVLGLIAQENRQAPSRQRVRALFQSYFVQDDVRVSSRLTLNLGLRWDPSNPWYEVDDKLKRFDPSAYQAGRTSRVFVNAPPGLLYIGDEGVGRRTIVSNWRLFAPRFGFAYRPFKADSTAIRGGYGIYWNQQVEPRMIQRQQNDPPFNLGTLYFGTSWSDPFNGGRDPYADYTFPPKPDSRFVLPLGGIHALSPDFRPDYMQQWNFTIEHQVLADILARVSYIGTKGTRLQQTRNINPAIYIPGASTVANTNNRRIYAPQYSLIGINYTDANSVYHAFQASGEKRLSHGVQFNLNYTWSKSIDEGSAGLEGAECCGSDVPQNPLDRRSERGPSSFDVRHRMVFSGIWNIPAPRWRHPLATTATQGWELAPILTMQTGAALNIITGQDRSFSANGFDRPNIIVNPVLPNSRPLQEKLLRWFDPSVFVLNPIGQFGNLGRNAVRGPGFINLDLGLYKNFSLKEYGRIQFRWEMFNAPNHVNPGNPTTTMGLNLGRIFSTRTERIMQLSLKYLF